MGRLDGGSAARRGADPDGEGMARRAPAPALAAACLLAAAACRAPGPRPLALGQENCAHCHMTVADPSMGGELVLVTGRVIPFDDVGCLASFLNSEALTAGRVHS